MNRNRDTRDGGEAALEVLEPRLLLAATFTDVTASLGLPTSLPSYYLHSGAIGDVNGDGYQDLFYGSFGTTPGGTPSPPKSPPNDGTNRLFISSGGTSFTESFQVSVNDPNGRASGAVFADMDNDGDLDLLVMNNYRDKTGRDSKNQLLRNDGTGLFTDVTAGSNLDFMTWSARNPFVLDYDNDGWLDVLVQDDWFSSTDSSRLMRNNHNMTFTDVTVAAGLPTTLTGIGGAVGDLNGDTYPDILFAGSVPTTSTPNCRLFLNDGDDTFTEYAAANTIFNNAFPLDIPGHGNEDWVCGADFGDLDNDGDIDVVIGQHYGSGFKGTQQISVEVFKNTGNDGLGRPQFTEITAASGVTALYSKMPHVEIQDFDNDGLRDIWVSNTMELAGTSTPMPYVLYNTGVSGGNPHFSPPPGLDPPNTKDPFDAYGLQTNPRYLVGGPSADFDNDGKLDIFAVEAFHALHYPAMYRNTSSLPNYIDVQIRRATADGNVFGIGAKVQVYQAGHAGEAAYLLGTGLMEIGNGYVSGRPAIAHFGVPGQATVDVVVTMPNGGPVYTLANATTNQLVTLPFVDTEPPEVSATVVNRNAPNAPSQQNRSRIREIAFTFDEPVNVAVGDLSLYDHSTSTNVDLTGAIMSYNSGTDTATWDLSAVTLNDAYHTATLSAANITDMASNHLDGDGNGTGGDDYTYLFHKLAGDANGNAMVNVGDLGILGYNYNTGGNWWQLPGDMDLNGLVNVGDLGILGPNYNMTLTPPPSGGILGEGASGIAEAGAGEPAAATAQGVEGQGTGGAPVQASQPSRPTPAARTIGAEILSPLAAGASARPIRTTISSPAPGDAAGEQAFDALALSSPAAPVST